MNKQDLLDKISKAIDKLEGIEDLSLDYLALTLSDYNPDNTKYEKNYSYRQFELTFDKNKEIEINDLSEDFKGCGSFCKERGFCNGDC